MLIEVSKAHTAVDGAEFERLQLVGVAIQLNVLPAKLRPDYRWFLL